jgi:hypothetical protein
MAYIARVAKDGFNANTALIKDLNFYESAPTFKILKQMGCNSAQDELIHGLNYPCSFYAYSDESNELFPSATDKDTASMGGRNFMIDVGDDRFYFDSGTNKRFMVISDVPSAFGYADLTSNEDFKFIIKDDGTPQKTIMSSEFNHLKEYMTGTIQLSLTHTNDGSGSPPKIVINTAQTAVNHNLGFRPFCLVTAKYVSYSDNVNDAGLPYEAPELYALPHNDIQYYNPIGFVFLPGNWGGWKSLYFGITNNQLKLYAKQYTWLYPGTDPFSGQTVNNLTINVTYEFTYKIFYNDLDENFSYL